MNELLFIKKCAEALQNEYTNVSFREMFVWLDSLKDDPEHNLLYHQSCQWFAYVASLLNPDFALERAIGEELKEIQDCAPSITLHLKSESGYQASSTLSGLEGRFVFKNVGSGSYSVLSDVGGILWEGILGPGHLVWHEYSDQPYPLAADTGSGSPAPSLEFDLLKGIQLRVFAGLESGLLEIVVA